MASPEQVPDDLESYRKERARKLRLDVVSVNELMRLYGEAKTPEEREAFLKMISEHRAAREEIVKGRIEEGRRREGKE